MQEPYFHICWPGNWEQIYIISAAFKSFTTVRLLYLGNFRIYYLSSTQATKIALIIYFSIKFWTDLGFLTTFELVFNCESLLISD